jgi:hypothetical protein
LQRVTIGLWIKKRGVDNRTMDMGGGVGDDKKTLDIEVRVENITLDIGLGGNNKTLERG